MCDNWFCYQVTGKVHKHSFTIKPKVLSARMKITWCLLRHTEHYSSVSYRTFCSPSGCTVRMASSAFHPVTAENHFHPDGDYYLPCSTVGCV